MWSIACSAVCRLATVEAGNLYVNRGITGAIVQRQPFGGWKRSSVGAGTKAGGPNYLFGLGNWVTDPGKNSSTLHLRGLEQRVTDIIEASQSSLGYAEFDTLRRSALSDALAWREEFNAVKDVSGVGLERNLFRFAGTRAGTDHALEAARTLTAWAAGFVTMELNGGFNLGGDVERAWEFGVTRIIEAITATPST